MMICGRLPVLTFLQLWNLIFHTAAVKRSVSSYNDCYDTCGCCSLESMCVSFIQIGGIMSARKHRSKVGKPRCKEDADDIRKQKFHLRIV